MAQKRGFFCLLLLLVSVLCAAGHAQDQEDEKEWFTKNFCDDGKHMLEVDWDGSDIEYTCPGMTWPDLSEKHIYSCHKEFSWPRRFNSLRWPRSILSNLTEHSLEVDVPPIEECDEVKDKAWHSCMVDGPIVYPDTIPTSGMHRPVAPAYGEYRYIPPQRWVHALEHGAAVFLYHPCASPAQVEKLKRLARGCLRRHIITPYRKLEQTRPLAIVTWGCKLQMPFVDGTAVKFVREHALRAPERRMWMDGHYKEKLLVPSDVVPGSDINDDQLCVDLVGLDFS